MTKKKEVVLEIEKKLKEHNDFRNLYDSHFDDWKYHTVKHQDKEQLLITVKFLAHMLSYNMEIRQMTKAQFEEYYYNYLHDGINK